MIPTLLPTATPTDRRADAPPLTIRPVGDELPGGGRGGKLRGMFPAKCPVDGAARDWVEDSLHLLASEFGRDAFAAPTVEPTDAFFPEPYAATLGGGRALLRRTAEYVGTDVEGIDLAVVPARSALWLVDDRDHEAAPSAPRPDPDVVTFAVELADLAEPDVLVGMFARELCGLRLSEEAGVETDAYDYGPLADLLAAYVGLGLFAAAIPPVDRLPGERVDPVIPPDRLGYALAHRAWHAGEEKPDWAKWLPGPVKTNFKRGLKWLLESGSSDFPP